MKSFKQHITEQFIVFGETGEEWKRLGIVKDIDTAKELAKDKKEEFLEVMIFDKRKDKIIWKNNRIR